MEEVCCLLCGTVKLPMVAGLFDGVVEPACVQCAMDREYLKKKYNMEAPLDEEPALLENSTTVLNKVEPIPTFDTIKNNVDSSNMGYIIYTNGSISQITFEPEYKATLNDLNQLVKGPIQVIPLDDNNNYCLVVNENGKIAGLPYNQLASRFWRTFIDEDFLNIHYYNIVGNAVILPTSVVQE